MSKIAELVTKSRSYRRFYENDPIEMGTLRKLIELARLAPTGGNLQPLKFLLSCTPEENDRIFPHLAWAGYLQDWAGPQPGERPAAYIVVLGDKEISKVFGCDHGIAAQTIMLGAAELGLGGCMIGMIQRDNLRKDLQIPERYDILLVLALGKPKETVILEKMEPLGSVKYWRDEQSGHHVPKRSLDELIVTF